MEKLTEQQILLICVLVALCGMVILFFVSNISEKNYGSPIAELASTACAETISFSGTINKVETIGNITRMQVSGEVFVIVFDKIEIQNGDKVAISGIVQGNKDKKEIIANNIKKMN